MARQAARGAFERMAELEDVLSDWRAGSEVRRVADLAADSAVSVSAPLCTVLAAALRLAEETEGAFDPTVGPLTVLWRESRRTGRLPAPVTLDSARALVGWRDVSLGGACRLRLARRGMRFDLGAIAKGYILDRAGDLLKERGIRRFLLEAGGDALAGTETGDSAVSTSGPSVQFVDIGSVRYSHVVDPRTGLGRTTMASATVVARDAMTSDALATALTLVADGDALLRRYPGARRF